MSVGTTPLTIHDPESIPTVNRISRVTATSPMVLHICRSNVFHGTL